MISVDSVREWGYEEATTALLLEFQRGAAHCGPDSVCAILLDHVRDRRPRIVWTGALGEFQLFRFKIHLGFAGFALPTLRGYLILLNPKHVRPTTEGTTTLAHELNHTLWNSHGFDSLEEEFYCSRVAGKAYQEILQADGMSAEQAYRQAVARVPQLGKSCSEWVAAQRRKLSRNPLKTWVWFDSHISADIASNLALGLSIHLGFWGYPLWATSRRVGRM